MQASIIIPVYNQLEYFRQCIDSIRRNAKEAGLIIVDNGSDFETRAFIDSVQPDILIRNKENRGVAIAWNQGLRLSQSDYLFIINSDIVLGHNFLTNMTKALEREDAYYVQPRHLAEGLPADFEEQSKRVSEEAFELIQTSNLNGFCFGIKRQTIEKIGYFDEAFLVWVDKDYVKRLDMESINRYQVKNVLVHHFQSKTLKDMENRGFTYRDSDERAWAKKWP